MKVDVHWGHGILKRILQDYQFPMFFNPYKMLIAGTLDQWMWDSFSFENGIIRSSTMLNMTVDGSLTITLEASAKPSIPTFTASAAMSVLFNGYSYSLPIGG